MNSAAILLTASVSGDKIPFITLGVVLAAGVGVLIFLIKYEFGRITGSIDEMKKDSVKTYAEVKAEITKNREDMILAISKNNDKINERIDKLEDKTNCEIKNMKQEINDIKGDFATTFVQRDDFFRYMNGMEDNIKETGRKVDKILLIMNENKGRN